MNILEFMDAVGGFDGPSWHNWRVVLAALFGLPVADADLPILRELTGRSAAPTRQASEAWFICGRRAGKSRISALVACYLALCRDWTGSLAPGERGVVHCIASDRQQAQVVFRYIKGIVGSSPDLTARVERETAEAVEFTGSITIEVRTASYRSVRGYTTVGIVADETAFWRGAEDDAAAEPDREIFAALKPSMATIPGAVILGIGTPYRRRGEMFRAFERSWGRDGTVLVVKAPTRTMNAGVPQQLIDDALAEDEQAARSEYLAEWRTDVESFLTQEVVRDAVDAGRGSIPMVDGRKYFAFVDPSGGSGTDSMTLCVAHAESAEVVVDHLEEIRPPFSPDDACVQFAAALGRYGLTRLTGDAYAGDWPKDRFSKLGITYMRSERNRSELYLAALPLFTSGRIRIPDSPRLVKQLLNLERRTTRSGKDSVDHPPRGNDDVANVLAGAACLASQLGRGNTARVGTVNWGSESLKVMPDGIDARGREWRGGLPFEGVFPDRVDFSPKGLPLTLPPKYRAGQLIPLDESEARFWTENQPRPSKRRVTLWG